jgi:N-acetylmuramoyl-L-alanine amidase
MDNPSRLVIDVKNAKIAGKLSQPAASHPLFSQVRTGTKSADDLRIVIDLKESVTSKSHTLVTNNSDNHHLVVNLRNKHTSVAKSNHTSIKLAQSHASVAERQTEKATKTANTSNKSASKKRFIVAIDAGHGGDDPGAKGVHGTLEKKVTLAIAQKLQDLINAQAGMKAKLVRKADYYVGLRERMKIARQANADLFVSIHADACDNPEVRGASVYTLSRTGASTEAARWLANNENSKEKLGGVDLEDKDEMVATVLLDLSQTATQQASKNLANSILKNFQNIGGLHYNSVQEAGFAVLKSPDIPSILVETAYISNLSDELNLTSERYQTKMANALFKGILKYAEQTESTEINRIAKL